MQNLEYQGINGKSPLDSRGLRVLNNLGVILNYERKPLQNVSHQSNPIPGKQMFTLNPKGT